jgi:hypothetical protein
MAPDLPRRFGLREALLEPRDLLEPEIRLRRRILLRIRDILPREADRRRRISAAVLAAAIDASSLMNGALSGENGPPSAGGDMYERLSVRITSTLRPKRNARWTRSA